MHESVELLEVPRMTLPGVKLQVSPEPGAIAAVRTTVPE